MITSQPTGSLNGESYFIGELNENFRDLLIPDGSSVYPMRFQKVQFMCSDAKDGNIQVYAEPNAVNGTIMNIALFLKVFQHPDSGIEQFKINFSKQSETFFYFLNTMKTPLRVDILQITALCVDSSSEKAHDFNEKLILSTWEHLDGVETFEIVGFDVELLQLTATPQWKHLKVFECNSVIKNGVEIENFKHLEKISIMVDTFSLKALSELVRSFTNRHLPIGSRFQITSATSLPFTQTFLPGVAPPIHFEKETESMVTMIVPTYFNESLLNVSVNQLPSGTMYLCHVFQRDWTQEKGYR